MRRIYWLLLFTHAVSMAQEKCGVNADYFSSRPESNRVFENWISDNIQKRDNQFAIASDDDALYKIPVVFHIVHNGENIGEGINLSEERILEQLQVLNEDFRRLNADSVNTPEEFVPVAADTRIEFVLAKRDPEGLPTNGIVRVQGSLSSYRYSVIASQSDEPILKAESYWPAEEYLNFWITDLAGGTLGYATFPFSNLEGINQISNDATRDGVVVDYEFIGFNDDTGTFNSFGRTGTHELGHYLGLKHVNGDGGCSVDDFIEDTPLQSTLYGGQCPSSPRFSCESSDMYSNYLNYTDDACMNIFTRHQKRRMRIVLENSPRRTSLLTSPALNDAIQVNNDLGIKRILAPGNNECTSEKFPVVEVRNYGIDTIRTFTVSMSLNGVTLQTIQRSLELAPLQTSVLNFEPVLIEPSLSNIFSFSVLLVDDEEDLNDENDTKFEIIYPSQNEVLPFTLDFESQSNYELRSTTGSSSSWQVVAAPAESAENNAFSLDFYNDSSRFGEMEFLITPVFDFSALNSAELSFKYSYSGRTSNLNKDGLIVAISTDCGDTFEPDEYLFSRYGSELATTTATDDFYVPSFSFNWREVNLNLTAYTGYESIKIAFIGHNGVGNALYLDDIIVTSNSLKAYDLGIRDIKNVSVVTCDDLVVPTVEIKNHGFETVSSYDLSYRLEDVTGSDKLNAEILSGEVKDISLEFSELEEGEYNLFFTISNPDGNQDEFTENDEQFVHFVVDDTEEALPLREDFEESSDWIITNSQDDPIINYTKLGSNTVLKVSAYNEIETGSEHWVISPKLLMENLDSASMEFRYAYAGRTNRNDRLRVLLSVNCGKDFQFTLFDRGSQELSEMVTNDPFVPENDTLWTTEVIDLSEFTIWEEVRVAFVFTNGNGNNLFLDDIEFFTQSTPPELRFEEEFTLYPNPAEDYFKLSLNLPEKEDIIISVIDLSGKIIFSQEYPNALNQELTFETPTIGGFYFLRISGKSINTSKRILIRR